MKDTTRRIYLLLGIFSSAALLLTAVVEGAAIAAASSDANPSQPAPTLEAPTTPTPGIPTPAGAIATPDGGFVTPVRTKDDNGNPLNIVYDDKGSTFITPIERAPTCVSSSPNTGIYQEGANWSVSSNSQVIGYSENWKLPTGTFTGSGNFVYYNPVNFHYPFAPSGKYDFFQVDFGLGPGAGSLSNWFMTTAITSSNTYVTTTLPSVTVSAGSTYRVDAMLEPYPLANPSSYVVQITLGSNSWLRSVPLGYTPNEGSFYINTFQSYQDQYLGTSGTTTVSSDTNTNPAAVKDVSGSLVFDSTLVTSKTLFDSFNSSISSSVHWDILSPSSTGTKSFNDAADCSSWP